MMTCPDKAQAKTKIMEQAQHIFDADFAIELGEELERLVSPSPNKDCIWILDDIAKAEAVAEKMLGDVS
jgi:hypothetical protein